MNRVAHAAENDRKLKEQEAEMERLEEEKEKAWQKARIEGRICSSSVSQMLTDKISDITGSQKKDSARCGCRQALASHD